MASSTKIQHSEEKSSSVIHFRSAFSLETTQKLFLNKDTADVFFVIDSGAERIRIPAHKNILAMGSNIFYSMFYTNYEHQLSEIRDLDTSAEVLVDFLRFFYSNNVTISAKNIVGIMSLAKTYNALELLDICYQYIANYLPIDSVCLGFALAIADDKVEVMKKLEENIRLHAKEVFESKAFLNCSQRVLKRILQIDNFLSEAKDIFNACLQWGANACEQSDLKASNLLNIRGKLGKCIHLIPFDSMSSKQVSECIATYKDLFDRDELAEIINIMGSNNAVEPSKFKKEPKYWLKQTETVVLTSSGTFVLNGIKLHDVQRTTLESDRLTGTMTIIGKTHAGSDCVLLANEPILFEFEVIHSAYKTIRLQNKIIMKRFNSYTIQILFDQNWTEKFFYIPTSGNCIRNIIQHLVGHFAQHT